MKRLLPFFIICAALIYDSAYVVTDGTYAVLNGSVIKPGLHFKWPFIDHVSFGNMGPEILSADGSTAGPFLTAQTFDKQNVEVGYQLAWQVADPKRFYQASKTADALAEIRTQLNTELGLRLSQLTLSQLQQANQQVLLSAHVLDSLNATASKRGIKCISLMISSLNVPSTEQDRWIASMKTTQQETLDQLRQQTSTLTQTLQKSTDQKAANIVESAQATADKIRSQADLDATQIYTDAYNKDPAFYEFFHNLQMYKQLLTNKQNVVVLSTKTPFFKSMDPNPQGSDAK